MSDFLATVTAQALPSTPDVQPTLPARYAPMPAIAGVGTLEGIRAGADLPVSGPHDRSTRSERVDLPPPLVPPGEQRPFDDRPFSWAWRQQAAGPWALPGELPDALLLAPTEPQAESERTPLSPDLPALDEPGRMDSPTAGVAPSDLTGAEQSPPQPSLPTHSAAIAARIQDLPPLDRVKPGIRETGSAPSRPSTDASAALPLPAEPAAAPARSQPAAEVSASPLPASAAPAAPPAVERLAADADALPVPAEPAAAQARSQPAAEAPASPLPASATPTASTAPPALERLAATSAAPPAPAEPAAAPARSQPAAEVPASPRPASAAPTAPVAPPAVEQLAAASAAPPVPAPPAAAPARSQPAAEVPASPLPASAVPTAPAAPPAVEQLAAASAAPPVPAEPAAAPASGRPAADLSAAPAFTPGGPTGRAPGPGPLTTNTLAPSPPVSAAPAATSGPLAADPLRASPPGSAVLATPTARPTAAASGAQEPPALPGGPASVQDAARPASDVGHRPQASGQMPAKPAPAEFRLDTIPAQPTQNTHPAETAQGQQRRPSLMHPEPAIARPTLPVDGVQTPGQDKAAGKSSLSQAAPLPTIRITIGRIEVRTTAPDHPPAASAPGRPRPAVSLDDYLKRPSKVRP